MLRTYAIATDAFTVSLDAAIHAKSLRVGTAGNVNLVTQAGNTVLVKAVQAGETLPIAVSKVLTTSTTASDIIGYI